MFNEGSWVKNNLTFNTHSSRTGGNVKYTISDVTKDLSGTKIAAFAKVLEGLTGDVTLDVTNNARTVYDQISAK